jgi:uncharacterized membrane protein YciS (DUF1049 family)
VRFLKTLFWIVAAALVTFFAARNWRDVTIDLWGNLQADVKLPVLLLVVFALGFVPTWLALRAQLWRVANRATVTRRDTTNHLEEEPEPAE